MRGSEKALLRGYVVSMEEIERRTDHGRVAKKGARRRGSIPEAWMEGGTAAAAAAPSRPGPFQAERERWMGARHDTTAFQGCRRRRLSLLPAGTRTGMISSPGSGLRWWARRGKWACAWGSGLGRHHHRGSRRSNESVRYSNAQLAGPGPGGIATAARCRVDSNRKGVENDPALRARQRAKAGKKLVR